MIFRSETQSQFYERARRGIRKYAWFPVSTEDGYVVWLDHYYIFARRSLPGVVIVSARSTNEQPSPFAHLRQDAPKDK